MLEAYKEKVLRIAQRAQRDGLCKHRSGNFSYRDIESGLIAITPSGVDREKLQAKDILIINGEGHIQENLSNLRPTSETLMHLAIYKTRPSTHAIVHTHSLYATSFAILGKQIPAVVYEALNLGLSRGRIPVAPYARPGSEELAQSIVGPCKEAQCFLLERHGVVACDDSSLDEAYLKASYVEEVAHLYYNTLVINHNQEPPALSQQELDAWKYPDQVEH